MKTKSIYLFTDSKSFEAAIRARAEKHDLLIVSDPVAATFVVTDSPYFARKELLKFGKPIFCVKWHEEKPPVILIKSSDTDFAFETFFSLVSDGR